MENLINFITHGDSMFSPTVLVGLIVFMLILESLTMLVSSILGVSRK